MDVQDFIKPELIVLAPVLYIIGIYIKKSKIKDKYIPLILGAVSILLCGIWVFSTCGILNFQCVLTAIFTSVTQGILLAGTTVYANQVYLQAKKDE